MLKPSERSYGNKSLKKNSVAVGMIIWDRNRGKIVYSLILEG